MLRRVDRYEDDWDGEIFGRPDHVGEPPPTPRQMFGQIAIILGVFLYMSATLTLLAHLLAR
jgi:hypothetical protein